MRLETPLLQRAVGQAALALVILGTAACDRDAGSSSSSPAEKSRASASFADPGWVLAEDRLGPITLAEVDRFVLDLGPGRRFDPEVEPAEWYAAILRRLAVDRLLYDEAVLVGADRDPELIALDRTIQRNAYSDHFLSEIARSQPQIGEEELRAAYEERRARFERGERREVFHIFKRFRNGENREARIAEAEDLRARALAGESFELLAQANSDSETRHNGGHLGMVPRGRFPEDFDRVVFALAPGVPSDVVKTADGAHVFLVRQILEERSLAFEDARRLLIQELEIGRREEILARSTADLPLPAESFTPGRDEVVNILRTGDGAALVLRTGEFQLTAAALRKQVDMVRRQLGARQQPDLLFRILDEIRHREIIYQHLLKTGLPEIPRERIEKEKRQQLIEYYGRRRMTAFLENQPQRIEAHYNNNVMRFATPLKVHVRHLSIPRGDDAPALMARLETARQELDAGRLELGDLAESLGGRLRDLGLLSAAQLQAADRKALRFAFQLRPGEHSPPYQLGRSLVIFKVEERQESAERPLALVREQVVQDYLANYAAAVFKELTDELLTEAEFTVRTDRLAEIGPVVATAAVP